MNITACLPEAALWPATVGEDLAPAVAVHLQQCAHCTARVTQLREQRRQLLTAADESCAAGIAIAAATAIDVLASSKLPEWIGGYRVLRLLTLGGQAEVYLARHPTLCADVVVKWAHLTIQQSPATARRFADEAQLLARLRHSNLVRVYDVGIAAGRPYLVMEHVVGRTLNRTGQRPFPPRDAAATIARIARALHAVHEAGRLHLDVQPDNILIDSDGEPRLIDFGMAARRGDAPDDLPGAPRGGTPEYMSPEQLAGDVGRIDVQADIYALGAVLHELLTGSPPQPECLWAGTFPVSHGATNHSAPLTLRRICRRALDPEPTRRFASALDFARALERAADRSLGSISRIAAGLLILAFLPAGIWCLMPLGVSVPPPPQVTAAIPREPREAVQQFLARASGDRQSVHIYLQDGRCVPVGMERQTQGIHGPQPERIEQLTRDLLALHGTSLIAVRPVEPGDPASASRTIPPPIAPLPPLPAGTMAHLTDHDIRVLACGTTPAARSSTAWLTGQLRRVQSELLHVAPLFDALLFASDAATDSPSAQATGTP